MPKKKLTNLPQPFYSDLLARSLLRIGVPRYEAFGIAHNIWQEMSHKKVDHLQLAHMVKYVLIAKYPHLVEKYQVWRNIMKKKKPLIVLVGGGTGVGTSTIAMRMAWLLEINRIVGSDSVREVIRQFLPAKVLPLLSVSTYETASFLTPVKSHHDGVIYGFLSQSRKVMYGIEALIKRSIKENESVIIEGVHLVPGEMEFLKKFEKDAVIIQVMIDVKQQDKHRLHFFARHLQAASRAKTKYLKFFKEIRMIRDFLIEQSEKNKVPILQNYDLRRVEKDILDIVYNMYENKHKK